MGYKLSKYGLCLLNALTSISYVEIVSQEDQLNQQNQLDQVSPLLENDSSSD